jgi:hypothetical protein
MLNKKRTENCNNIETIIDKIQNQAQLINALQAKSFSSTMKGTSEPESCNEKTRLSIEGG